MLTYKMLQYYVPLLDQYLDILIEWSCDEEQLPNNAVTQALWYNMQTYIDKTDTELIDQQHTKDYITFSMYDMIDYLNHCIQENKINT